MADMRKCIGSAKFGIEAHEAPADDFPVQPSQKDGLGRMCKPHWTAYTRALRMAANASKTATARKEAAAKPVKKPEPIRTRPARGRKTEGEQIVEAVDAAIAREAASSSEPVGEPYDPAGDPPEDQFHAPEPATV